MNHLTCSQIFFSSFSTVYCHLKQDNNKKREEELKTLKEKPMISKNSKKIISNLYEDNQKPLYQRIYEEQQRAR